MSRRARVALGAALGAALLLAGCARSSAAPDFAPSPSGGPVEGSAGVHVEPILPTPSLGQGPNGTGGGVPGTQQPSSGLPPSGNSTQDPLVVATRLTAPVGLTLLPDGTALVGERTTGRIVRVKPQAGQPVPTVRTLTGLDAGGDGGLLDLAVSPDYAEDNLIFAYVTTPTDNRVVDFTLHGPVTPVLTGIPRGPTDNGGRIAFDPDGSLLVATGDAGRPALAQDPRSLAGKILRVDAIGAPAAGNPSRRSPVYASGIRSVTGLCADATGGTVLGVQPRPAAASPIDVIEAGADYGWPQGGSPTRGPVASLPATYGAPGGCAVLSSRLWVTSLDGRALLQAPLHASGTTASVGAWSAVLVGTYGRLRTVVPAPDGALWITTSNRDGKGKPVAADERVIRYPPQASGGGGGGKIT